MQRSMQYRRRMEAFRTVDRPSHKTPRALLSTGIGAPGRGAKYPQPGQFESPILRQCDVSGHRERLNPGAGGSAVFALFATERDVRDAARRGLRWSRGSRTRSPRRSSHRRTPRPSRMGTIATCRSSTRPARRNSRTVDRAAADADIASIRPPRRRERAPPRVTPLRKWKVVPPAISIDGRGVWVRTKTGTRNGGSSPHQPRQSGSSG